MIINIFNKWCIEIKFGTYGCGGVMEMITHLTSELNRINQEILLEEECKYPNPDEDRQRVWRINVLKNKKETLKKVSLMWADEMSKIFDYEEPISKELQQIKSLIENQEDFQKLGSHEPSQMEKA